MKNLIALFLAVVLVVPVYAKTRHAKPVWWKVAVRAAASAWLSSLDCQCEQSFAIDLKDEQIIIRHFKGAGDEYHSGFTLTPATVAVFHTHLHDAAPSPQDREIERRSRVPIYVIHEYLIVESN